VMCATSSGEPESQARKDYSKTLNNSEKSVSPKGRNGCFAFLQHCPEEVHKRAFALLKVSPGLR
jgi:hypothetical protein